MKNLKHFSDIISSETVGPEEVMVSFDVQSLFTNVPIDKALVEDETLRDRTALLRICLRTTYFMQFYEQIDGAAMGFPVSPVVANIFMQYIEEAALSSPPSPVRFWKRYVDNTYCSLQRTAVDTVLEHLNEWYISLHSLHGGTRV